MTIHASVGANEQRRVTERKAHPHIPAPITMLGLRVNPLIPGLCRPLQDLMQDMQGVAVDDQELAEKAKNGCRNAFAALIERHYDRIYRLAWRLSGSRAEAEDIAQDVCVKLAVAIRTFRGEAAFSTWVWRVTYNTASDWVRAARRVTALEPSRVVALMDADAGRASSPEDKVIGAELWDAVRALPEQQREAVLLVYGEGLSHADAASVMGCREKTVSWHLHEAKKRLKVRLQSAV